ncbi:hypothetical protein PAT3040_01502 [Paenibacillus agaridevorans]|uniref:Uncharacterized protein n=1 Tax=Paenibacillus agaridevorans TaxID=171404 RepID=A0A2R5EJZ8_9BACL|nr:hypothetical protein [Paenibacillus agaridevorans]GBG06960.1 hypothetical protein PAT3040_01502 [Paenibacillus agaridevorans]
MRLRFNQESPDYENPDVLQIHAELADARGIPYQDRETALAAAATCDKNASSYVQMPTLADYLIPAEPVSFTIRLKPIVAGPERDDGAGLRLPELGATYTIARC